MIAAAFIEHCLGVLMYAVYRVIGVIERMPGKGPGRAITDQREYEDRTDYAPQHFEARGRDVCASIAQDQAEFRFGQLPLATARKLAKRILDERSLCEQDRPMVSGGLVYWDNPVG